MAYKHILVAVDLSPESSALIEKAVSLAKPYEAKVSLIHVGINYSDLYTGLMDINMADVKEQINSEVHKTLIELGENSNYAIAHTLSANGDFGQVMEEAIKKYDIDLVVCGHHKDFWSKLMSSAKQLINQSHIDVLIVPLNDDVI